jgi:hypothetical protein
MTWVSLMVDGTMAFRNGVPTLADMQQAVGGNVEAVAFPLAGSEATMWVDGEGKLVAEPQRNWKADVLCPLARGDWTAGDVVFTGGVGSEGETLALSDAQAAELRRVDRDVLVLLLDDDGFGVVVG